MIPVHTKIHQISSKVKVDLSELSGHTGLRGLTYHHNLGQSASHRLSQNSVFVTKSLLKTVMVLELDIKVVFQLHKPGPSLCEVI